VDLLVELVVELACHVQANTNSKLGSGTDLGGVGCSTAHASRGGARQLFWISTPKLYAVFGWKQVLVLNALVELVAVAVKIVKERKNLLFFIMVFKHSILPQLFWSKSGVLIILFCCTNHPIDFS